MVTAEDIQRLAMCLPEVEAFIHFRQKQPGYKVRGTAFAGLVDDGTAAVFSVPQDKAAAAVADPAVYREEWRPTNPRTFLGLRVELTAISEDRLRELLDQAWRAKAPRHLVKEYGG